MTVLLVSMSITCGILAGLLQVAGYALYARDVMRHGTKPNTASWLLWGTGAILDLWSYATMTGDWVKNVLPVCCCICCLAFCVLAFVRGRFTRPSFFDICVIVVDLTAIFIWVRFQSSVAANMILQCGTALSFVPIAVCVRRGDSAERPVAWILWSAAYFSMSVAVGMRLTGWPEMVYPLNSFVLSGIVTVLVLRAESARQGQNQKGALGRRPDCEERSIEVLGAVDE